MNTKANQNSKFLESFKIKNKDSEMTIAVKKSLNEIFSPMLAAASLPISGLPAITLPPTGSEIFPCVQSGVTDQISIVQLGCLYNYSSSTVGVPSVGSYVTLYTYPIPANTIAHDGVALQLEFAGSYSDDVNLKFTFGAQTAFTLEIAAPVGGPQAYAGTFILIRLNTTQAIASLTIQGGTDVDAWPNTQITTVSALSWTGSNNLVIQGQCNNAINTLNGQFSRVYIK